MRFFKVTFGVTTTPERPNFWNDEPGWCIFWLFARDHDDANARAKGILEMLPFELVDPTAAVFDLDEEFTPPAGENAELRELLNRLEADARACGLAFAFWPTGAELPRPGFSTVFRTLPAA